MIKRFNLHKIHLKIIKNNSLFLLIGLVLITIISTQIYNVNKKKINSNYFNLINNIYFQKNLKHILNNLEPRYKKIEHIITKGEAFDKILSKYEVPKEEIKKIKNSLPKKIKINNLKPNQRIIFTIDKLEKTKITSFLFPISRTEKIQLTRDSATNNFIKKKLLLI